ncbi:hypothetical protein [Motiliproteus sp. MSK22-1]|uniref:hypothetical protein n=1 Tax=Motiliproteus sp. MSK22-1 TaxID=1897630 RepID=UPI0009788A8E|nr:hypothetical protein [Motiliproteus sp. MSK22-1]OMH30532.1 hypothetical protein BGP75_17485 [Motiliproteus sp. MSK22-1]
MVSNDELINHIHAHMFEREVDQSGARELLDTLVTSAPPRNREAEAVKAKQRSVQRFGSAAPE